MKLKTNLFFLIALPPIFLFLAIYLFSGMFMPPFNSYANTLTTEKFTWELFDQVKVGDSKESIEQNFGEPFFIRKVGGEKVVECWRYTRGGKIKFFKFGKYYAEICVDNTNTVIAKHVFQRGIEL